MISLVKRRHMMCHMKNYLFAFDLMWYENRGRRHNKKQKSDNNKQKKKTYKRKKNGNKNKQKKHKKAAELPNF